jgi:hypothetical protein
MSDPSAALGVPGEATTDDPGRAIAGGARPRRFGAWYVAEHRFRVMWSYAQTILVTGFGEPIIYLYAMGVGLATLVDQNPPSRQGASATSSSSRPRCCAAPRSRRR